MIALELTGRPGRRPDGWNFPRRVIPPLAEKSSPLT